MIRVFFTLLVLALAAAPARAQDGFEPMADWQPYAFKIVCPEPQNAGVLDSLASMVGGAPGAAEDCVQPDARATIESDSVRMLIEHKRQGFPEPLWFGPVIDQPDGARAVRISTNPGVKYAQIASLCDPGSHSEMQINPVALSALAADNKHVLAYIASHELFHTIQKNFINQIRPGRAGPENCFPPFWVGEGMADAVAISAARKAYPRYFPPRPTQAAGESWAGLRPYDVPLYHESMEAKLKYRTSSFWRFLAEFYHRGRLKFLERYASELPPGGLTNEDWLAWLDEALQKDPQIGLPLYLVYPGFLTHFAGEWEKGGDGEKFGKNIWLGRAFGNCRTATVTPDSPYAEIDTHILPMSGKCLQVRVEGLSVTQHATVKVGVLTGDEALADSLHLGFAFTNDQTKFNCASHRRKGHMPYGIAGCLLEPVTGTSEDGRSGRFWNGTVMEYGPGPVQSHAERYTGGLENTYVLTHTPPKPEQAGAEALGVMEFKIAVGLEITDLSAEAGDVNKGGEDGARKSPRRRAAGAMGMQPSPTDQRLPAATGYVDMGPVEAILGVEVADMIGSNNEVLGAMNDRFPGFAGVGQPVFRLAEVEVKPVGSPFPIDDEELDVIREFNIAPKEPLPDGATGTFEAGIYGFNWKTVQTIYISPTDQLATLTIHENSHDVFRADISGPVCEFQGQLGSPASPQRCTRIFQLSGSISKPYAYLYKTNSELVSRRTEGEDLYNKHHAMMTWTDGPGYGGGDGAGGGGGGGGGSSGAGGQSAANRIPNCDCACPDVATPATTECRLQCAPRFAQCQAAAPSGPRPPTPTVEAQRRYLSRLIGDQGLSPEAEQMLLDDFSTMSDETRAYLIKKYRGGVR